MPRSESSRGVEGERGTTNRLGFPPNRLYAQAPAAPSKVASDAGAPPDHSPVRYVVKPLKQPNWSACWYTATLILLRWRDAFQGRTAPRSRPEIERIVFASPAEASKTTYLFELKMVAEFAYRYRMIPWKIKNDPQLIHDKMKEDGPLLYMTKAGDDFQHMLVIYALRYDPVSASKARGVPLYAGGPEWMLEYADPDGGRTQESEMTNFFAVHPPTEAPAGHIYVLSASPKWKEP